MSSPLFFPRVRWPDFSRDVTFIPTPTPAAGPLPFAVIVFALQGSGFVLANVRGRGWCVPSGRIEPGETPEQAAIRETYEEIGADLLDPHEIGHYVLTDDAGDQTYAPVYAGRVAEYGAIPPGSESAGARVVPPEQIPACYYRWDDLIARVFEYAEQELRRNP